ncbi:MAG: beta-lactamase family protein [Rikenellaceae bacterium]|nr:beta-lactamase family protein [Rikenellaceae bacterium]
MKTLKKMLLGAFILLILAVILIFTVPALRYIPRALVHRLPEIDQYRIFDNRTVEAAEPQPWPMASDYGRHSIPDKYMGIFEALETVAYIVIQDDSLVFEKYWDGYGPDSYSNSFSMAKSIVSLLTGIAIAEGYIESLDTPVSDYIPGIRDFDGRKMTVEHLLTMSAGVEWNESYAGLFSPTTRAYYGKDLCGMVGRIRQVAAPGERTVYQSGVTQMLGYVLRQATGRSIGEYASEKLWKPMGAEYDALWSLDGREGMGKAYCCFNSNARDFARFGKLILDRGRWNDRRLVPEWYMEKAIAPAEWLMSEYSDGPNHTYGYQFWILEKDGVQIPYMRGILGQYILAVPGKNAIFVRLGKKRSETRTKQNYPDDVDTWLDAGMDILRRRKSPEAGCGMEE